VISVGLERISKFCGTCLIRRFIVFITAEYRVRVTYRDAQSSISENGDEASVRTVDSRSYYGNLATI
jgi:hypothetical protein